MSASASSTAGASVQAGALSGGCLCGQVRYEAQPKRMTTMVCHCRDCQKQSGSAFSVIVALALADIQWQGEMHTYANQADSGRTIHRRFCPDCGSPMVTEAPDRPGMAFLKAGTLDDTSWLKPTVHLWCQSRQPWVPMTDDVPCLATQPPSA